MNKSDMIKHIAETADITQAAAQRALEGFCSAIKDSLKAGQEVVLVGFGSFSAKERAARDGRNPKTGEKLHIKAKKVVKFSAGKDLKTAVE